MGESMAILAASSHESQVQPFTILRVHGVNGWSSEETLQAADAAQVAGDDLSGFYRRQGRIRAGDPEDVEVAPLRRDGLTLEAYSWGSFSSKLPVQAFWLLLIPFSFINLAGWMLRPKLVDAPQRPSTSEARTLPRPLLGRLIRLLGLTLTLEFFLAVIGVMVGVVGEQCGARKCNKADISRAWLPPGFTFLHPGLPSQLSHRLVFTVLFSVVVLMSLWWLCWFTRRRYEQWPPPHHTEGDAHRNGRKDRRRTAGWLTRSSGRATSASCG